MLSLHTLAQIVTYGCSVAIVPLVILMPDGRMVNGRHISRPIRRRFGPSMVVLSQMAFALTTAVAILLSRGAPFLELPLCLWLLDDFLTGDDDDPRHRFRDWAKAKLKKFAAVKLRPVQRWTPIPS
jgi:hypothetical protein